MKIANVLFKSTLFALCAIALQGRAATRFVNQNYSTPAISPYTSWATAAHSIQDAVDAAVNGDTVVVSNGTYWLTVEISVTKNITIESVNGPAVTTVYGNDAVRGFNLGSSACVISGFSITNCRSPGFPSSGGGILCSSLAPIVNNCRLIDNYAGEGGGIFKGTVNNSVIRDNNAYDGGGLHGSAANNCVIVKNHASNDGGGMYVGTAINCTIAHNDATGDGGGIVLATAHNCILYNNPPANLVSSTATYTLGGLPGDGNIGLFPQFVNADGGDYRLLSTSPGIGKGSLALVVGSTDVDGNPRVQYGTVDMGAYEFFAPVNYVAPSGLNVWPYSSWATAATSIQTAAAVAVDGATVYVTNGTYLLTSEIAVTSDARIESVNGPAVTIVDGDYSFRCFNLDAACTISGFTIRNGFTEFGDGGGVFCSSATPVVTNCIISGCEVYNLGGGMYSGTANDCTIIGNFAFNGGGIDGGIAHHCIISGNTATVGGGTRGTEANHCTISANWAYSWGGGMYGGMANNCLITGNVSEDKGGGIYFGNAKNCTIRGNEAFTLGGGVYDTVADNSILWYNTASSANDIGYNFDVDINNSCSPDVTHGTFGNITSAPLFVDNSRLAFNSPCIGSGNNSGVASNDLDGRPRIVNGTVDMGAYEYDATFNDSNTDGIPDSWGIQYFGSATGGLASANGDADPVNNGNEYIAGTDPTNSASYFGITNQSAVVDGFVLNWESIPGRVYSILWSGDLTNDFQTLETGIAFPQSSYTDTNHTAAAQGFYELTVQLAE